MKIGMMTGLWYVAEGLGVLDSLERIAALNFRYVDLHGVFHAGPAHLSEKERAALKPRLNELGLTPRNYVLHPPHNIPSATPAELESSCAYLKEGIDLAYEWGVSQLMLNAGKWAFEVLRTEAWTQSVTFIQRVCDYAATRNVFIAQEAEPYVWFLVNDIPSTLHMLVDVNRPNFATLLDLGHSALSREGIEDFRRLGSSIIHAHFSDHEPFLHTNQVIGSGFVPTEDYLAGLKRLGIDDQMVRFGYEELVISIELGVPGDRIDDPDQWVKQSLAHIQACAPYVTQ